MTLPYLKFPLMHISSGYSFPVLSNDGSFLLKWARSPLRGLPKIPHCCKGPLQANCGVSLKIIGLVGFDPTNYLILRESLQNFYKNYLIINPIFTLVLYCSLYFNSQEFINQHVLRPKSSHQIRATIIHFGNSLN